MSGGIEKLAVEIEEIANGVYPSEKPAQELLISKAKKIRQLGCTVHIFVRTVGKE